jgi:hypothetical protein
MSLPAGTFGKGVRNLFLRLTSFCGSRSGASFRQARVNPLVHGKRCQEPFLRFSVSRVDGPGERGQDQGGVLGDSCPRSLRFSGKIPSKSLIA